MFRGNANGRYMSGVIRLKQTDHEAGHETVLRHYTVGDRLGRTEQVFEGVTAVGFTVHEAALIQPPTFVYVRHRQRPHVVTDVERGHQRNVAMRLDRLRLPTIPPARSKFLKNCHGRICSTESVAEIIACLLHSLTSPINE